MKKKVTYFALVTILVWAMLISWNWAPVFADKLGCSHVWFDLLSVLLGLGALVLSCAASGELTTEKREG